MQFNVNFTMDQFPLMIPYFEDNKKKKEEDEEEEEESTNTRGDKSQESYVKLK